MKTTPLQVVLVEDDPCDAALSLRELKTLRLANDFVHLSDGEAALDFFFSHVVRCPCLLFLDLDLPKVDGFTVLARLKSDKRTRTIPVVILTGTSDDALLAASYDLGAASYLVKPLTREKLLALAGQLGLVWQLTALASCSHSLSRPAFNPITCSYNEYNPIKPQHRHSAHRG